MQWYEWILYILLIIAILGVLVSIHEAGHLSMAKAFNVYCFEYSIGFGPAIIHKKRKKGETYFSVRVLPLGGYVSMYGEPGAVPDGVEEPPVERSLNSIAKWKKCIVLLAGVTLNFALGLVLIYIGDAAFPMFYSGTKAAVDAKNNTSLIKIESTYSNSLIEYISTNPAYDPSVKPSGYSFEIPATEKDGYFVLDSEVYFYAKNADGSYTKGTTQYVALYAPSTVINTHNLSDSFAIFPADTENKPTANDLKMGITALPKIADASGASAQINISKLNIGTKFEVRTSFAPFSSDPDLNKRTQENVAHYLTKRIVGQGDLFTYIVDPNGKLNDSPVTIGVLKHWNNFAEGWQRWATDVPAACGAIGQGFASLFQPGGFNNLSGIVGMTAALPQINASGGGRMIFYFAGLLSINLAFFNLLPFPGLDGYAFVVTLIEGATKKKVPQKVSSIMSLIGFVLLIGLVIAITVKDIVALI